MDNRDDIMRHFPTLLARWKGASGRLWELTSSHPILRIALYDNDRSGCLEVICIDPERIEAPRHWKNADIVIEKTGGNGLFNVIDRAASVYITNCGVEVKEFSQKPHERR